MEGPLYLRGIDRALAEDFARRFVRRYRPPISCGHHFGKLFTRIDGVCGLFRKCSDCGQVEGRVG